MPHGDQIYVWRNARGPPPAKEHTKAPAKSPSEPRFGVIEAVAVPPGSHSTSNILPVVEPATHPPMPSRELPAM